MPAGIKANNDGSGAIQVGGTDVIGLGTAGQWGIGGSNYGTAGQVLTSSGASAAPTWAAAAGFPTGTVMLFAQTSAPTGWTKDTTHNNKALRLVNGTVGSGGSVAFTTAFASQSVAGSVSINAISGSAGATTLSINEIPSHTHGYSAAPGPSTQLGLQTNYANFVNRAFIQTSAAGGGGSHTHPFSFSSGTAGFSGTAINLAVQYVDVILATKN